MKTMGRLCFVALASGTFLMSALSGAYAEGIQQEQLVGSWTMVSDVVQQGDKQIEPFGPHPLGTLMLDQNGRFSVVIVRPGRAKFASSNRETGTPEENRATSQGSLALFGTYSFSTQDQMMILHIEGSTFPNWEGTSQKRLLRLSGDELIATNPTPSIGAGTAQVVWKRVH